MSPDECLKFARLIKLLEFTQAVLPPEERHPDGYLSLLLSAMASVIKQLDPYIQNTSIIKITSQLHGIRPPVYDENHCENCKEANEIAEAVIPKLSHIEPEVAISSLGFIIKTLLDTISDEEVFDDCLTELEDTLFPDNETETLH